VVDGTGLENRHTRKGIGGSNPSLSATQSGLQRNSALGSREIRELCLVSAIPGQQTGLRRTDWTAETASLSRFFSGSHTGSPDSTNCLGECNAITNRRCGEPDLTLLRLTYSFNRTGDKIVVEKSRFHSLTGMMSVVLYFLRC
jgi:hypothetical protein